MKEEGREQWRGKGAVMDEGKPDPRPSPPPTSGRLTCSLRRPGEQRRGGLLD